MPKPVKYVKCDRDPTNHTCQDGRVTMMAEYHQDYYLYTRHFSRLKRRGIYLDIAANDPRSASTTYFLDACLGWEGMCVEADPRHTASLRKYRTCHVTSTCVSNSEGQKVSYLIHGVRGGISETNKNLKELQSLEKTGHRTPMTCTTVRRIMQENGVTHVDYLSLDVEGHELMVLQGVDWDRAVFKVITVEATEKDIFPIVEDFLISKGYNRHIPTLDKESLSSGLLMYDAVFLHSSVVFGSPV